MFPIPWTASTVVGLAALGLFGVAASRSGLAVAEWHNAAVLHLLPGPLLFDQIGETDCETIGDGWLAQPANAISSGAYILFGVWILVLAFRNPTGERATQLTYGAVLAAVGIGSIAFHGPMPAGARLLHDLTIAAVFALIAARGVGTLRRWGEPKVLGLFAGITTLVGVAMAISPEGGIAVAAIVGVAALGLEVSLYRSGRRQRFSSTMVRWLAGIVTLLLAGALINVLGRTGGPLCDPDSVWQGHAAWHVLTAAAFGLYGYRSFLTARPV